jgi:MoaA/NifB/PqqE/SkfB family radical SAM enzyme
MQMRERLVNLAKEQKKPLLGHFELTSRCNLDCKMCYVHTQNSEEVRSKELTTEQWKKIFDEAYESEMLYAYLTGGECLLRKDFKELYLHLWNKRVMVSVQTNGTLLDDEYVEFFKTYRPDVIRISLYGSNEEGYLKVTGHTGFAKTIAAISALQEAGIDVRVVVTPSKYMLDDYIDILQLCEEKGFAVLQNELILLPNRTDSNKGDYYMSSEEIVSLSKQRAELHKELIPVKTIPEPQGRQDTVPDEGLHCNAGNCLAAVTWEGKMYPCLNAMVGGGADLRKMSYGEAWKHTVAAASEVLQGAECVGCPYDKVCPKCPALRLTGLKTGHCNPAVCELTRRLVAAGVKKLDMPEETNCND